MRRTICVAITLCLVTSILSACSPKGGLSAGSFHTKTVIAPNGPTVVPLGNLAIANIPQGSAPPGATVEVTSADPPTGWQPDQTVLRAPVHLQLSSGNLSGPATLSFPYDPADVPAGVSPTDVFGIATFDQTSGQWLSVPITADTSLHTITAEVTHFSWWNPFSWDWSTLGSEVSQDALQAIGERSAAPVCDNTSIPSYISTVNVESDASDPLRSCAETKSGILDVEMTSNRTYGMVMTYGAPVQWGWHSSGGNLVDKLFDSDHHIGSNQLYLPPLQSDSIGIPDSNFGFSQFVAQPTMSTIVVAIADLVIPLIPPEGTVVDQIGESCASFIYSFTAPVNPDAVIGDIQGAAACIKGAVEAVIASADLSSSEVSALIHADGKLTLLDSAKAVTIGVGLGATVGDLVLGSKVDNGLREFSILHAKATEQLTPTTTVPPATTEPPTTTEPGASGLAIGAPFQSACVVAWPTAPTVTSTSIILTMTCEAVPESQYLFTQVTYDDPNLDVTPDTGTMEVTGQVEDVAKSDLGYSELIVKASHIDLG
jgi:hypothetical protein